MTRNSILWLIGALLLGCLPLLNAGAADTNPAGTPITVYQTLIESGFFRGAATMVSADSTPATTVTTGAGYTSGVHLISFVNSSSNVVYVAWDATDASDTNYQIILPAGMGLTACSRSLVTTLSLYAASASTVYVQW